MIYFSTKHIHLNNKRILFIILLLLHNIFINIILAKNQSGDSKKINTIVIDPGHGGKDPGASGLIEKEKNIVLDIALKVGKYIEKNCTDVKIIYTRKKDEFVPLYKRAEIANKNHADLFISIHANASENIKAFGTSTFAMGLHKSKSNLKIAQRENSAILLEDNYQKRYENFKPNSSESYIIFSLLQNTYLDQSLNFASYVQDKFEKEAKRHNRGVKQAGFLVLWRTSMPSILIETGFISNPEEEKFLISEAGQDWIAKSIYKAFMNYKDYIESKSHFVSESEIPQFENNTISDTNSIIYKVQILSSKKQLNPNDESFKNLKGVEELKINDIYKYTVGNETDYNKIEHIKEKVKNHFPGAFIIATKNGQRISIREALKKENP